MYGILTFIYHKNQPTVGKYPYMDPMGYRLGAAYLHLHHRKLTAGTEVRRGIPQNTIYLCIVWSSQEWVLFNDQFQRKLKNVP